MKIKYLSYIKKLLFIYFIKSSACETIGTSICNPGNRLARTSGIRIPSCFLFLNPMRIFFLRSRSCRLPSRNSSTSIARIFLQCCGLYADSFICKICNNTSFCSTSLNHYRQCRDSSKSWDYSNTVINSARSLSFTSHLSSSLNLACSISTPLFWMWVPSFLQLCLTFWWKLKNICYRSQSHQS